MEWTNYVVLEFISLYGQHPVIWNPKNANYKKRKDVSDAWSNIQKVLSVDFSIERLKKKKECLMTTYRMLKKKVIDSSKFETGKEELYRPTWFAFNLMDSFLKATTKFNTTLNTENVGTADTEEDDFNDDDLEKELPIELNGERLYNENHELIKREPIDDSMFLSDNNIKIRKKRLSDIEVQKNLKRIANFSYQESDECLLYGQLLATKLRALNKRNRKVLMNQIDNLVFEAEMREMG